ncbi:MAG: LysM domain-containing protein [Deltaproteobacteria bacterium]|nr:LysM domain-containing protein [Deltaproteobacteria bacterium]
MKRRALALVLCLTATSGLAAGDAQVTLPLADWRALGDQIDQLETPPAPPVPFALASRSVIASFSRGVLTGSLDVDIVSYDDKQVLVPLIDDAASLSEVLVDGKRAVALREGERAGVMVTGVGRHSARITFALGQEQDRFERAFELNLPQAPRSRLSLQLPERDLDVRLQGGVILDEQTHGTTTHIEGAIDASGRLVVQWARRALHQAGEKRELETRIFTLAQLGEEVVTLKTVLAVRVVAGETDRLDVAIPAGLEVVNASGPAVLQWFSKGEDAAAAGGRGITILLKHIVDDETEITVEAQMPRASTGATTLAFLAPRDARVREGFVAVEGRAGFEVKPVAVVGALDVGAREIPQRLLELSDKPLLFGYRYEDKPPSIGLEVKANAQLDLTQAVIDELQVSTVVVEKGTEITKLKLAVRNNTRQYLSMRMPLGAVITHALIDGAPFHPAIGEAGQLLVPLRQSEKLSTTAPRRHVVQPGETLGGISLLYFNKTDPWQAIMSANPEMATQNDLAVGRAITIPSSAGGVTLEESSFVLEIAYKVAGRPLGAFGQRAVALPHLDIPVIAATWHVYLPTAVEPLSFDSNLKQMNGIRYDPLRRAQHFLDAALRIRGAWAGGYENILSNRKAIYRKEQSRAVDEPLSSFPLVGERYRFEQVLLGERQGVLDVVYLRRDLEPGVRFVALLLSTLIALRLARRALGHGQGPIGRPLVASLAVLLALGLLGHYVLGVHRMMLLGVDVAILIAIAPSLWKRWRERAVLGMARPLPFAGLARLSTLTKMILALIVLVLALKTPLLLTTFGLVALLVAAIRLRTAPPIDPGRRPAGPAGPASSSTSEVPHA